MRFQVNMTSIKMSLIIQLFFLESWNHTLYFFKACHDRIHVLKNKVSFLDLLANSLGHSPPPCVHVCISYTLYMHTSIKVHTEDLMEMHKNLNHQITSKL